MGPLCSGRPTPAHTTSFRALPRARSRHLLGVTHVPLLPRSRTAPVLRLPTHACRLEPPALCSTRARACCGRRFRSGAARPCTPCPYTPHRARVVCRPCSAGPKPRQLSCGRHSCALLPRIHSSCAAQLLLSLSRAATVALARRPCSCTCQSRAVPALLTTVRQLVSTRPCVYTHFTSASLRLGAPRSARHPSQRRPPLGQATILRAPAPGPAARPFPPCAAGLCAKPPRACIARGHALACPRA
jgi:hypothetical protein